MLINKKMSTVFFFVASSLSAFDQVKIEQIVNNTDKNIRIQFYKKNDSGANQDKIMVIHDHSGFTLNEEMPTSAKIFFSVDNSSTLVGTYAPSGKTGTVNIKIIHDPKNLKRFKLIIPEEQQ